MCENHKNEFELSYRKSTCQELFFAGNKNLINQNPVVIYCSRRIPLSVFEQANQIIAQMLKGNIVLAGGWQSPMEKRLLRNVKGLNSAKIIYFLAKGIQHFRPLKILKPLLKDERLLVLSPFEDQPRITRQLVELRDQWVTKLIQHFLFIYLDPRGKLRNLFKEVIQQKKHVFILQHPENRPFINKKVTPVDKYNLEEAFNDNF